MKINSVTVTKHSRCICMVRQRHVKIYNWLCSVFAGYVLKSSKGNFQVQNSGKFTLDKLHVLPELTSVLEKLQHLHLKCTSALFSNHWHNWSWTQICRKYFVIEMYRCSDSNCSGGVQKEAKYWQAIYLHNFNSFKQAKFQHLEGIVGTRR